MKMLYLNPKFKSHKAGKVGGSHAVKDGHRKADGYHMGKLWKHHGGRKMKIKRRILGNSVSRLAELQQRLICRRFLECCDQPCGPLGAHQHASNCQGRNHSRHGHHHPGHGHHGSHSPIHGSHSPEHCDHGSHSPGHDPHHGQHHRGHGRHGPHSASRHGPCHGPRQPGHGHHGSRSPGHGPHHPGHGHHGSHSPVQGPHHGQHHTGHVHHGPHQLPKAESQCGYNRRSRSLPPSGMPPCLEPACSLIAQLSQLGMTRPDSKPHHHGHHHGHSKHGGHGHFVKHGPHGLKNDKKCNRSLGKSESPSAGPTTESSRSCKCHCSTREHKCPADQAASCPPECYAAVDEPALSSSPERTPQRERSISPNIEPNDERPKE